MRLELKKFYSALAPRLVVLVSSVDGDGNVNAAPFSFVMPVSMDPPLLALASAHERDTLANIRETGEFVVNLPSEEILKELWICAKNFPRGIDEIEKSGLTEIPSERVNPPRIEECVAWFECKLVNEFEAGDHVILLGEVLAAGVKGDIIDEKGNLDISSVNVPLHLGGPEFAVPGRVVSVK
ncbi:MAG TPA: flavin reductase family protein [Candidatus Altiarchaeales archaeon]|nr:flavin reductase family protein [Candidatus Altiarchaeales archaeon]